MTPLLLLLAVALQGSADAPLRWCDHPGQVNCMTGATPYPPVPPASPEIVASLEASARAWSRGDLQGFMASYDERAIMLTADGHLITPRAAIEARYQRRYGREGGRTMSQLTFDVLGESSGGVGADITIVYGRFHLLRPGAAKEDTGVFDLVMHRTPQGWRILSDHTS